MKIYLERMLKMNGRLFKMVEELQNETQLLGDIEREISDCKRAIDRNCTRLAELEMEKELKQGEIRIRLDLLKEYKEDEA
jgi:chromosome segregation ATPase